jgi:hypothetical protein
MNYIFTLGERKESLFVHCVHPEHWKPVLDHNIRDVLDVHTVERLSLLSWIRIRIKVMRIRSSVDFELLYR